MAVSTLGWRGAWRRRAPRSYHRAQSRQGAHALTQLRALGAAAEFLVIDITRESDCHAVVKTTLERFGRVNVLVNNAGGMSVRKRPEEYTSAEWHSLIDTNLTSANGE